MRTRISFFAAGLLALLAPRAARADSCVPGFDFALFGRDMVALQADATTDSYDSSVGVYLATSSCTDGDLGTNSTANNTLRLQSTSASVCGDAIVGNGGSPASVIDNNGTITGTLSAQTANVVLTAVTLPTRPGGTPTNPVSGSIPPEFMYNDIVCTSGSIHLDAGVYVADDIELSGGCQLVVDSGPVEVYFTGKLDLDSGTVVNTSNLATNLVFYTNNAGPVELGTGTDAAFAVYAPSSSCALLGNSNLFGALSCREIDVQNNAHIHYDRALANLAGAGFTCPFKEVSRATPIIATIGAQTAIVQGTFVVPSTARTRLGDSADLATFSFPFITGHMRARTTASISTTGSSFSSGTTLFDAGATGKIPPVINSGCGTFDGTCRNVFTVTTVPDAVTGRAFHPPHVQLNDGNSTAIGALMAPTVAVAGMGPTEWQTLVRKVLAGKLGGVDRSTVAVIPASPLAGLPSRPTIAYFGATDGMLHAVCASVGTGCPSLGVELWAFMPRVQLPLVRENTQRIDGSPRVVDVFGDFASPVTGTRSFRTILTFQTGFADTTLGSEGAVYSLDVTDPAAPIVLWEKVAPTAPAPFKLGVGLATASSPVLVAGNVRNLTFAQTNNAGTGGAGIVLTAIGLETGLTVWEFTHAYETPPRGVAADLPLPATGIPGGAVAVDTFQSGYASDLVMGDLFGSLWRIAAEDGQSRTGVNTVPTFRMSTNKKPIGAMPAVYSDGAQQFAVFGTGGYADPLAASWSAGTQVLASVPIAALGPYPFDETSPKLDFKQDLTAGQNVFGQVLVVGNEVFVTTDETDVNESTYGTGGNTGHVVSYNMSTSTPGTSIVVRGGAASLASFGNQLYGSSSDQQQELSTGAAATLGNTVDSFAQPKLTRRLWLRTQ
jgi:hypothetical protein